MYDNKKSVLMCDFYLENNLDKSFKGNFITTFISKSDKCLHIKQIFSQYLPIL